MFYAAVYSTLLWAILLALHNASNKLLMAQSKAGVPSYADRRWAECAFTYSRVALVTCAVCAVICMALDTLLVLSTPLALTR